MSETNARARRFARVIGSLRRNGLITRLVSLTVAVVGVGNATGAGVGEPTSCPGDGGGGGTSGRAALGGGGAGIAGVETDGVGRDGYGVPTSTISGSDGVPRFNAGAAAVAAAGRTGVAVRGVMVVFVSGVVAPTLIRMIAPQTLHRARTPFGGTFAGSTRNTDRQS